jgi:hypothetical protein
MIVFFKAIRQLETSRAQRNPGALLYTASESLKITQATDTLRQRPRRLRLQYGPQTQYDHG